jgi:hypothetical protein
MTTWGNWAAPSTFGNTASAPARSPSRSISEDLCKVNSRTGSLGVVRLISRVVCRPFMPGIMKSKTTRSGRNSATFSRASFPSFASAQTSIPHWVSRIRRISCRIMALSSTTRIRFTVAHPINDFARPFRIFSILRDSDERANPQSHVIWQILRGRNWRKLAHGNEDSNTRHSLRATLQPIPY